MKIEPLRGEIWIVALDPVIGHEQAKKRPCIVISNNIFNKNPSELVVVIPLTSRYKKVSWLVEIGRLGIGDSKIESYALCNHLRTVSLKRFSKKAIGKINDERMKIIEMRVRVLLDL